MADLSGFESTYDEALIINELERRYYLYLIGGAYEKLFYVFSDTRAHSNYSQMQRIRLDVEVSQAERQELANQHCCNVDYKNMLEYILKTRISHALEHEGSLLELATEVRQILPFLRSLTEEQRISNLTIENIYQLPWLKERIQTFLSTDESCQLLGLKQKSDFMDKLLIVGLPLFYWLLPRWVGEGLRSQLLPSLRQVFDKVRLYSRIMAGAIACLSVNAELDSHAKWRLHCLSAISVIPITILLSIIDNEVKQLLAAQQKNLSDAPSDDSRRQILANFQVPGELLRETLSMEQIVKPHILESLQLSNFNPIEILTGYADQQDEVANIYHQARAYSFYRQLYKTGRIHLHETAIFLKQYNISRQKLTLLNQQDLSDLAVQVNLLKQILDT